jgi:hypothetical protein
MSKFGPHLTLDQLTVTQHTEPDPKFGKPMNEVNKTLAQGAQVLDNLSRLDQLILEPMIEALFPAGLQVHDAFRYPALNAAVGGSPTSQHQVGQAADFIPVGYAEDLPRALFMIAAWGLKDPKAPKFGQLLIENGCLHISLPRGHNDGEVATWAHGVKHSWRPLLALA